MGHDTQLQSTILNSYKTRSHFSGSKSIFIEIVTFHFIQLQ